MTTGDKNSLKTYEQYLKKKLIKLEVDEIKEEDMVISNGFDKSFDLEDKLRKVPE